MTDRRYVKEEALKHLLGHEKAKEENPEVQLDLQRELAPPKKDSKQKVRVQLTIMEKLELLYMIYRSVPD